MNNRLFFGYYVIKVMIISLIFFYSTGYITSSIAQQPKYYTSKDLLQILQQSKPDTNQILLQYSLGKIYLSKQGIFEEKNQTVLDSAILVFSDALHLSDSLGKSYYKNESRCLLGDAYLRRGDIAEGIRYYIQAITEYHTEGNKEKEADSWQRMGTSIPREKNNFNDIQNAFDQALHLFREMKDSEKEAGIMLKIADLHFIEGKTNQSEKELIEVLETYKKTGYDKLYDTYYLLSVVNRYKGDFDKSLVYAKKCVQNMEAKNTTNAEIFYGELALVYQELGQAEESVEWYRKDLDGLIKKNRENVRIYRTAGFLILELIKLKREKEALSIMSNIAKKSPPRVSLEKATVAQNMGYCYNALKQYHKAENYFLQMIKEYENSKFQDGFTTIAYRDIGRFYLEQKKFNQAQYYLRKATVNLQIELPLSTAKDIYLLLFKADSAMGNYIAAIKDFQQHKNLNDSIFNDKRNKQIEELQVKYETAKKESAIALLKNRNNTQQNKLKSLEVARNATISGALILFVFIYYRYRLKQKTNKKLEIQQIAISQQNISLQKLVDEKEWLIKEIHHRVKNNFHIVMGLLGTQSGYLKNEEARIAIKESQQRIQVMSLIHQRLYQSNNLSSINMHDYIHELVEYLKYSYDISQKIDFDLNVEDIMLDHSYAIPLGLILNEAITNSIKYAFPNNNEGIITISLQYISAKKLELLIVDNGIGISNGIDLYKLGSMGLNLIQGLSGDIGASFFLSNTQGTRIAIVFPYEADSNKNRAFLNIQQSHIA